MRSTLPRLGAGPICHGAVGSSRRSAQPEEPIATPRATDKHGLPGALHLVPVAPQVVSKSAFGRLSGVPGLTAPLPTGVAM